MTQDEPKDIDAIFREGTRIDRAMLPAHLADNIRKLDHQ